MYFKTLNHPPFQSSHSNKIKAQKQIGRKSSSQRQKFIHSRTICEDVITFPCRFHSLAAADLHLSRRRRGRSKARAN